VTLDSSPCATTRSRVCADLFPRISQVGLVDHHVHGTFTGAIDRSSFEEAINEGSPLPIPPFMTMFDSQLGFAIRRWASPRLDLPRHASADEFWSARSALSPADLDHAMLHGLGIDRWVVDSGFSPGMISTPGDLAAASGAASSEIARLELIAEGLLATGTTPISFADDFRAAVTTAARTVVGFKSVAAYRTGFDIDWSMPDDSTVRRAVEAWVGGPDPSRLDNPVVIAFLVHAAAALRLPVQFHVGFGDRDLDLQRANPMLLLPLLRQPHLVGTPIMLLHCYPYHREAGYLAQAFDDVYFDMGLGLNYTGAQNTQLVRESLEVAPFAKQLYSSDAFGLPELHLLGSILWRRSMATVLGEWVSEGDWSEEDAMRVVTMIGAENAHRVYRV
jgi:hypothetical protein